jgi:3-dehydroquinate dehydratase-2
MMKILIVQGANLTFLGRREPEIYGTTTAAQLDAMLQRHAQDHDYHLDIFYTNIEGEAINRIYQGVEDGANGFVMSPARFTYTGYALKDCVQGAGLPYVEVHNSSIAKRNIHCVLSDAAEGMITVSECTHIFSALMRCWRYCGRGRRSAEITIVGAVLRINDAVVRVPAETRPVRNV